MLKKLITRGSLSLFTLYTLITFIIPSNSFELFHLAPQTLIDTLETAGKKDVVPDYVIALGGNAFGKGNTAAEPKQYWESLREQVALAAKEIAPLIAQGKKVVVTHGNGPQAGYLFGRAPDHHLGHHVLKTQVQMGRLLQTELSRELESYDWSGRKKPRVLTVTTHVEVDLEDPAFLEPTKPIGWFDQDVAQTLASLRPPWRAVQVDENKPEGWRLIVPSPQPKRIVQVEEIQRRLNEGMVVIAGGGGGIPVIYNGQEEGEPVEAVIDKDRASALLAVQLKAKAFVILTNEPVVSLNYRKANEKKIEAMSADKASRYLTGGIFPPGNMGPKIEGAVRFTRSMGRETLITKLGRLEEALAGKTGTRVTADENLVWFKEERGRTVLESAI